MRGLRLKKADRPPEDSDPPAQDAALQEPLPQHHTDTGPASRTASRSRNAEANFKGEKRSSASTTHADMRLYRKSRGTGAMLCFMGPAPTENCSGIATRGNLSQPDGHAECRATLEVRSRFICALAAANLARLPKLLARRRPQMRRHLCYVASKGWTTARPRPARPETILLAYPADGYRSRSRHHQAAARPSTLPPPTQSCCQIRSCDPTRMHLLHSSNPRMAVVHPRR